MKSELVLDLMIFSCEDKQNILEGQELNPRSSNEKSPDYEQFTIMPNWHILLIVLLLFITKLINLNPFLLLVFVCLMELATLSLLKLRNS